MSTEAINNLTIAVELLKKDVEQLVSIANKIDDTNSKLQQLINNISSIAAIHEEKLINLDQRLSHNSTMNKEDYKNLEEKVNKIIYGAFTFALMVIGWLLKLSFGI